MDSLTGKFGQTELEPDMLQSNHVYEPTLRDLQGFISLCRNNKLRIVCSPNSFYAVWTDGKDRHVVNSENILELYSALVEALG